MLGLDVCLSPELIGHYDLSGKTVVIVDILRATSCMTAGMANGVKCIRPFENLENCLEMRSQNYLIAGERNGIKVEGFDLGNSPQDYLDPKVVGRKIAVTTTNGTVAIEKSLSAEYIIIGSFLNISAVAEWIKAKGNEVIIVCAGWKGKVNLEDTLFAGALTNLLSEQFEPICDAPIIAQHTYFSMRHNLVEHVSSSSHAKRLKKLNISEDIAFCLQENIYSVVPILIDGEIQLEN